MLTVIKCLDPYCFDGDNQSSLGIASFIFLSNLNLISTIPVFIELPSV